MIEFARHKDVIIWNAGAFKLSSLLIECHIYQRIHLCDRKSPSLHVFYAYILTTNVQSRDMYKMYKPKKQYKKLIQGLWSFFCVCLGQYELYLTLYNWQFHVRVSKMEQHVPKIHIPVLSLNKKPPGLGVLLELLPDENQHSFMENGNIADVPYLQCVIYIFTPDQEYAKPMQRLC